MCNSDLLRSNASPRDIQVINEQAPLKKVPETQPGSCIDCYFKDRDLILCSSLSCIQENIIYVVAKDNF